MKLNDEIEVRGKTGKIVYIHPQYRFMIVQYPNGRRETINLIDPALIAKKEKTEYPAHKDRTLRFDLTEQNNKISDMLEQGISKKVIAECLDLTKAALSQRMIKIYGTSSIKKAHKIIQI